MFLRIKKEYNAFNELIDQAWNIWIRYIINKWEKLASFYNNYSQIEFKGLFILKLIHRFLTPLPPKPNHSSPHSRTRRSQQSSRLDSRPPRKSTPSPNCIPSPSFAATQHPTCLFCRWTTRDASRFLSFGGSASSEAQNSSKISSRRVCPWFSTRWSHGKSPARSESLSSKALGFPSDTKSFSVLAFGNLCSPSCFWSAWDFQFFDEGQDNFTWTLLLFAFWSNQALWCKRDEFFR